VPRPILPLALGRITPLTVDGLLVSTAFELSERLGPRLCGLAPVVPVTDFVCGDSDSCNDFAEGYFLTKRDILLFWQTVVSHPSEAEDYRISPIR
jgi:acetyl esterase/lipase